ncbi:hypothetical protein LCGC14_1075140 [marine sediment metagenome]|uniref:Uncharacterized protein n=1 Tax=marine sediment metagenome TaxID=412755 RepID=A0A0F9Q012_9ZZZZ
MTLQEIRIPNFIEYKLRIDTLFSSYQMMKGKHRGESPNTSRSHTSYPEERKAQNLLDL